MKSYLEYLNEVGQIFSCFDNLSGILVCLEILFKERFNGESRQELSYAMEVPII
jgi:hypothetical protein